MGGADDKPVWERIAELGFADAVESRGFKRVGKTHWRLDGDGIVHHVKLYRGFSIEPGSFRDFRGLFMVQLDTVYRKLAQSAPHLRVPYSASLCHEQSSIHDDRRAQRQHIHTGDAVPRAPAFRPWAGIAAWMHGREHEDRANDARPALPHYDECVVDQAGGGAWLTHDRQIDDVADVL